MIKLKTYKMVDEKYCTDCVCVIPSEVYLKKDADEAIATLQGANEEKSERIVELQKQVSMIQEKDMQAPREEMEQMFNRQYSQCKELKAYGMADPAIDEEYEMYKVADVDHAIAELKAKLAEKDEEIDKQKWRGDEWAKACNQKDKEIAELNDKIKIYEDLGSCKKGCPALRHNQRRVTGEIYKVTLKDAEIAKLQAMLEERNKQVAELKEERRWRKFINEKPEDEGDYLVMARYPDEDEPHIEICFYDRDGEDFGHYERRYAGSGNFFGGFDGEEWITHNVSFWMPLPKAPEEDK